MRRQRRHFMDLIFRRLTVVRLPKDVTLMVQMVPFGGTNMRPGQHLMVQFQYVRRQVSGIYFVFRKIRFLIGNMLSDLIDFLTHVYQRCWCL